MISFLAKHLTLTSTILRFERHLGTGHWDTELPSLMQWLWESCNWASSYGHMLILLHKWPFFIFFPSNIFPHLLLDIICLWWGYPDINHQSPCRNLTNPSKGKEYQPIRGRVRSCYHISGGKKQTLSDRLQTFNKYCDLKITVFQLKRKGQMGGNHLVLIWIMLFF